jgi:CheY-like chemotaxis protein
MLAEKVRFGSCAFSGDSRPQRFIHPVLRATLIGIIFLCAEVTVLCLSKPSHEGALSMEGQGLLGGHVLVVDDDPIYRRAMTGILEEAGCVCEVAVSHPLAIGALRRNPRIKLVLLDHGTAEGHLDDFVTAVSSIRTGITIVGSSASDCRGEFAAAGVRRFLRKPWDLDDLVCALRQAGKPCGRTAETRVMKSTDTRLLQVKVGQTVRVTAGSFEGLHGIMLAHRTGGRALVELNPGYCVEIAQFLLEPSE